MKIDDVVKIINERADLYEKISNELSKVISEINNEAKYRIDLIEELPYLRIEIQGLGVSYRIKPQDILNETIKGNDMESVILKNIDDAIHENFMKNR